MRLRKRFFIYFLALILLTAGLNLAITIAGSKAAVERFTDQFRDAFAGAASKTITAHYRDKGTLQGLTEEAITPRELVVDFPRQFDRDPDHGPPPFVTVPGGGTWSVIVEDSDGQIVLGPQGSAHAPEPGVDADYPLAVDGRYIGHLQLLPKENSLLDTARSFLIVPLVIRQVGTVIIASILALIIAFFISNQLIQPIGVLAEAARTIARGNLGHRVNLTGRDELGELAADFNTMAARLEEDQRLRRQLQADVVHELRTPLAVCQSLYDSLESGFVTWDKEALTTLQEETGRMNRLVHDLHELSKAETRQLSFCREWLYVTDLLERLEESFSAAARQKEVAFCVNGKSETAGTLLYVDPDRTVQIFINLLHNALRHTCPGGFIAVDAQTRPGGVAIAVRDSGCGIAPEHLPHIFDRFYRIDGSRTRQTGGCGLGLAIAREYALLQGGSITAESNPGQGSVFTVWLPTEEEPLPPQGR
ncbi:HAMP domain-containing protein [Heliobacterium gestii]|uniref:histidine kinase n=1 Tax=Heliomicrobium gestii TaxID=2699 RepID=A0A845LHI1_HELGE|nr:ATP-binding protein [Heliomicrobium gestii]MBM7866284.1 signal transduction histidine kinase [Heliomicrobium gestii]MZP42923.1 HAMP domain-containing protein [Heliomicrobium gestii]